MATITFHEHEGPTRVVEAESGKTLLEIAEEHEIKLGSACGGVCGCSSCHCYVRQGGESLEEMDDAEEDRLDMGFDVQPSSRLACQVKVPAEPEDLVVEISEESNDTWYNEHPEHRPDR